jgi:GNAT superfamily N-acetyltransferase
VQVRLVQPGEYEQVGQLVVAAYRALPGGHLSGGYAAELADVQRRAGEAEVMVAIAGEAGPPVGCVTFVPDASSPWAELLEGNEAGVRMLAVDPGAQRRGVGRVLLDACVWRAKELRRAALILHTTPWMTAAHHLYESSGFERFPDRDWAPVPEVNLLSYRLVLGERLASQVIS